MILQAIHSVSPLFVFVTSTVVGAIFVLGCMLAVRCMVPHKIRLQHSELISLTINNVAMFYGVLLAFLTVLVWQNFSEASHNVNQEAAIINNLYNDAGGLAPVIADDLQSHVRSYLQSIVNVEWSLQKRGEVSAAARISLIQLHRHIAAFTPASTSEAVLMEDMLKALNDLDSARAARLDALNSGIPSLVWKIIIIIGFSVVGLAIIFPSECYFLHTLMLLGIVVPSLLVMLMIVELDSPFRGVISISASPYENVVAMIGSPIELAKRE